MPTKIEELIAKGCEQRDRNERALVERARDAIGCADALLFKLILEAGDPIVAPGDCWECPKGIVTWRLLDDADRLLGCVQVHVELICQNAPDRAIAIYVGAVGNVFSLINNGDPDMRVMRTAFPKPYDLAYGEALGRFLSVNLAKYRSYLDSEGKE